MDKQLYIPKQTNREKMLIARLMYHKAAGQYDMEPTAHHRDIMIYTMDQYRDAVAKVWKDLYGC